MDKAEIRRRHRAERRRLAEPRASLVAAVFGDLLAAVDPAPGSSVAGYLPAAGEPDVTDCLRRAIDAGHPVLVPRTLPERGLEWVPWHDAATMGPDRYGLVSPIGPAAAGGLDTAAVALVPAIAVDSKGTRIGQGAGYYDRALSGLPRWPAGPMRVAVVHATEFLTAELPREPHDEPVDAVLTERGWRAV